MTPSVEDIAYLPAPYPTSGSLTSTHTSLGWFGKGGPRAEVEGASSRGTPRPTIVTANLASSSSISNSNPGSASREDTAKCASTTAGEITRITWRDDHAAQSALSSSPSTTSGKPRSRRPVSSSSLLAPAYNNYNTTTLRARGLSNASENNARRGGSVDTITGRDYFNRGAGRMAAEEEGTNFSPPPPPALANSSSRTSEKSGVEWARSWG